MIRMSGVSFSYEPGAPVIDSVDLEIPAGLTLLLGPNGCGKSTLLKIAAGVEMPDSGRVEIDGLDLWREEVAARRSLAYLPEQPDLTPYATVGEVMRLVCKLRGEPATRGNEALETAGLRAVAGLSIRELSMGQRRRAVLAAAMIGRPRSLLLDEPLEALDLGMRDGVLSWVERHRAAGALLVIATHEMGPFATAAVRAVTVRRGQALVWDPLPEDPDKRTALLEGLARGLDRPVARSGAGASIPPD